MARVRGPMASATAAGSMLNVSASMSTNTGLCAAVADRVGGGDEGVADGDHLVAGPDAQGQEREVQRRGAVADRTGVRRPDQRGELALEARHLRTLREPPRPDDAGGGSGLGVAQQRPGDRDHDAAATSGGTAARLAAPPRDQIGKAVAQRRLGDETQLPHGRPARRPAAGSPD